MSQDKSSKKPKIDISTTSGKSSKDSANLSGNGSTPVDPHNMALELPADDGSMTEATVVTSDDLPEELRDTRPTDDGPKTGLVSEFRDLTFGQSAFLVSNRETSAVSRSPIFYLTTLIIGLVVIAGLIFGVQRANQQSGEAGGGTIATVGMGQQAAQIEQQTGLKIHDTNSPQEAEQAVRDGKADAAFIADPTGMGAPKIIALDKKPTRVLSALQPEPEVTYLEQPAVNYQVAQPVAIGLAGLLIAGALTLAFAMYTNLRVEKRHRIGEVLAATIPPKSSAVGRVQGLTTLSVVYVLVAVAILFMGMSVTSFTGQAIAMLPAIGWFAALYLVTVCATLGLFLWASNIVGRRARQITIGVVCALVIVGAFLPLIFATNPAVMKVLVYVPFTAPVANVLHFLGANAEWWHGLLAVGISLLFALIVVAIAAASYQANLLRGTGRETLSASQKKRLKERSNDSGSDKDDKDSKDDKASKGDKASKKEEKKSAEVDSKSDSKKKVGAKAGTKASAKASKKPSAGDDK
ncbi:ABC transporter permease [Brevibacterium sp. ACRRH]|uniref:ABC transporter permease n=1 Tax=Brevibacterium sp. ACRRH TaxID=2918183 RepID=UPI001EF44A2D|nr:ABC transporter permease [Brevibacterium sp. ACRRH]MCG7297529.1 ABC transporter permease [Brevibacterium sp. ACRRH]